MRFRTALLVASLVAPWCAAPDTARAAGSMTLCLQAGFSQACCKAEEAKGGFNGDGADATARRWNSLAMCKSGSAQKIKR
ncbi:hypothetical protein ABIB90_002101 [Bradyrhizobium sp. JR4.1]|uniref:hypothetical protein n=1 Tax=unclassified Bradyrhizobium TaxID=2631580 RepID=UPI003391AC82